jgi:hypothetical protein
MDKEFIERNQIVERYLLGKLPARGLLDFERACKEDPTIIDAVGLADRVQKALRLLEATGEPEPWQEKPRKFWEQRAFIATLAALVVVLAGVSGWLALRGADASAQVAKLQRTVIERPLDPTTKRRSILVIPSRTGEPQEPMFSMGGSMAEQVEIKLDLSWATEHAFRVEIARRGQGSVALLHNMQKDSNGQVRLAVNSSAFGPGTYRIAIEGLDWRGQSSPIAWAAFSVLPQSPRRVDKGG